MAAAREGDLFAWEHIVRRYQEPVFRAAYLLTRVVRVAEQATESAFIRAYRALPTYDDAQPLTAWLFRIVIGEARQKRRDSGRTRGSSRPEEPVESPHLPSTPIAGVGAASDMTPAEREAIVDAFDRLGEEDRLIIASRYLFGLSAEETALALSLPIDLIDEHLAGALRNLRRRMVLAR